MLPQRKRRMPSHRALDRWPRRGQRRSPMSDEHRAACAANGAAAVPEVPSDVDQETRLLEDFTRVPLLSKATLRPAPSGSGVQAAVRAASWLAHWHALIPSVAPGRSRAPMLSSTKRAHARAHALPLQVQVSQSNLAANSRRQLQYVVHMPDPSRPAASALVPGLPTELQAAALQSVSPSGARAAAQPVQAAAMTAPCTQSGRHAPAWQPTVGEEEGLPPPLAPACEPCGAPCPAWLPCRPAHAGRQGWQRWRDAGAVGPPQVGAVHAGFE